MQLLVIQFKIQIFVIGFIEVLNIFLEISYFTSDFVLHKRNVDLTNV